MTEQVDVAAILAESDEVTSEAGFFERMDVQPRLKPDQWYRGVITSATGGKMAPWGPQVEIILNPLDGDSEVHGPSLRGQIGTPFALKDLPVEGKNYFRFNRLLLGMDLGGTVPPKKVDGVYRLMTEEGLPGDAVSKEEANQQYTLIKSETNARAKQVWADPSELEGQIVYFSTKAKVGKDGNTYTNLKYIQTDEPTDSTVVTDPEEFLAKD